MKSCLTESEIARVIAGDAPDADREHVAACERCARGVSDARMIASLTTSLAEVPGPTAALQSRLRDALVSDRPVGGATTLVDHAPSYARRAFWRYAGAVAGGAFVAMLFLLVGAPSDEEVSASEVLAQSLAAWSDPTGAELTQYELVLEGVARKLSPELADGTSVVEQLVDHETTGRYHVACYAPDGTLLGEIAQDPVHGLRTARFQIDDRGYFWRFTMDGPPHVGFPELTRSVMATGISLMQASADPKLTTFDVAEGTRYQVELPQVASDISSDVPWELTGATLVVDAGDFRVRELEASGSFFGEPWRVRYRLIHYEIQSHETIAATPFRVERIEGDRELLGVATDVPARDFMGALLRELD